MVLEMHLVKSGIVDAINRPQAAAPTPSSCAGKRYTIASGDDCYKVSKTNSIGPAWLLSDNNLAAYCDGFHKSGELCIQNTCKVYTIENTATCESIAESHTITLAQLKGWNPIINAGFRNLYKMNEASICVSSPGEAYVTPPALPPLAPSTATSAAPVPTDAKDESNRKCGSWYNVEAGDYCNSVTMRYGVSLEDFVFLNPSINSNCTNLLLGISYCVEPVGDINTYSGRPGFHTAGPTGLPFTKVTFAAASTTWTPQVTRMQTDVSGTFFRHQCDLATSVYDVTLKELLLWNPDLGTDISITSCSFTPGLRYCGRFYVDQPPPPIEGPQFDFPLREGDDVNCTKFGDVPEHFPCTDTLNFFQLSLAQFYKMNPAIGPDCSNLWTNQAYCIASPNAPAPSPSSSIANCKKVAQALEGDYCYLFAERNGITTTQLYAWNRVLENGDACGSSFWKDYWYCVGIRA
ncbi:carbohydrate-binding module family 50 protein [Plenodomus tracheiphilus IPT5]|uniref:Carbohydrate-binding module family 50 protein n=1 Tax=Plenodomus tracheiphilus IPT5 TaxID=1408161 RepID=A0A6A7BPI1_9PLEO|nr:carbohydrate-binding module family 50 protein [Plenodomus tracheiphilus IPT5]